MSCFWKLITFILQMHLHLFCSVLTRLPVHISLALNYFQNKMLFSEKLYKGGRFSGKVSVGGRFYKQG